MPMSFPDMKSLKDRALQRGFRQPLKAETEEEFRAALADHVQHIDRVESAEIRSGKGWDEQSPKELLSAMGIQLKELGL